MSALPKTQKLLLVDDHTVVREGLKHLLDAIEGLEVIGEAANGSEAVQMATDLGPHLVIMDIGLPILNGVEAARKITRQRPDIQVIILSMRDDAATVDRALRAGARGYVLKGSSIEELKKAVHLVASGKVYFSPGISEHVLQGYLHTSESQHSPLTEREREVLQLISEGYTSREIAGRLDLKPKTVQNHRANLMEKLDIHTTAGLVRYALSSGLSH